MRKKENCAGYLFSNKALAALILPLIVEQFLTMAVGMVDSVMISSVGESAVSGVSLVDSISMLMIYVFAALSTGGAVVAGQLLGHKQEKDACQAVNQLFLFTAIASTSLMLIGYLLRPFILNVIFGQIEPDVYANAGTYMNIVFASIPFIALYSCGAAAFRTMGNSKISMMISLGSNIVNIIGNAIMIYGLKMGVAGAAIPTLVSRMLAAVAVIVLLFNESRQLHFSRPFRFHFEKRMIGRILGIGIPNSLENGMFQFGKILLLSLVSGFGTAAITANAIGSTLAGFQILSGQAIGLAIVSVISRCIGAGEYEQAHYYTKKMIVIVYIANLLTNIVIFIALPFILNVYHLSAETAAITRRITLFYGICEIIIWPLAWSLPNVFRAAGSVKFATITGILSMWFCRIVAAYIMAYVFHLNVYSVWIAMILDWVVRGIFFCFYYRSGKWRPGAMLNQVVK